jgi:hypothetical protein
MDLWAIPETIDFFTQASISFLRQGQLRYTHNFGGGTSLQVAIENPGTRTTFGGLRAAVGATTLGTPGLGVLNDVDHLPDFVVAVVHVWKGVGRTPNRVKVSGVFRQLTVDNGGGSVMPNGGGAVGSAAANPSAIADSVFGWGSHMGIRYWVSRNDQLQLSGYFGEGMGRYQLGSTLVGGAVINGDTGANNMRLNSILSYGGHIVWKHHWTDTIRSNVNLSWMQMEVANATTGGKVNVAPGVTHKISSGHVNIIWSPVKAVNIGIEYQYARRGHYNLNDGTLSRLQMAFQYNF